MTGLGEDMHLPVTAPEGELCVLTLAYDALLVARWHLQRIGGDVATLKRIGEALREIERAKSVA